MNRKQLILLLVALVVLGGAGLMLLNRNAESWSTSGSKLGQKVLPNFPVNDISDLHIKGAEDLDLIKQNDRWVVRQRNDYPANFSQIKDLLLKIDDLKIAQAEPIGSSQLGRMHLAPAGSGPEAATLLEFKDAQGKTLDSLLLGKKHTHKSERASPMSFGNNEMPDGRYVMLQSDPHEVLTVSDPLTTVDPKPAGWLDKDFFKVEKVKSVTFVSTNAADSWSMSRESESGPFVLAGAKTGEILDTNKASSLASALGYPSFVDVAADNSPAKTGMDKPLVVTITTFDHFTYTLKVGAKTPENNYNLNVTVTANFPTERLVGKDEKPDGKKMLDKVFQDNLKPSIDKLHQEAALDKTTYLVNSWLIDPLIRTRSQLMVDKKDEKKETGSAPGSLPDDKADAGLKLPSLAPNDQ